MFLKEKNISDNENISGFIHIVPIIILVVGIVALLLFSSQAGQDNLVKTNVLSESDEEEGHFEVEEVEVSSVVASEPQDVNEEEHIKDSNSSDSSDNDEEEDDYDDDLDDHDENEDDDLDDLDEDEEEEEKDMFEQTIMQKIEIRI